MNTHLSLRFLPLTEIDRKTETNSHYVFNTRGNISCLIVAKSRKTFGNFCESFEFQIELNICKACVFILTLDSKFKNNAKEIYPGPN